MINWAIFTVNQNPTSKRRRTGKFPVSNGYLVCIGLIATIVQAGTSGIPKGIDATVLDAFPRHESGMRS